MKYLKSLAYIILLIGGINWGLYGLFSGFDLVDFLLGFEQMFANIVYVIVGLSALFVIFDYFSKKTQCCKDCSDCEECNNIPVHSKDENTEQETKIFEIKTGEEINIKN